MHTSDRYSIGYSFMPKKNIGGNDLITGFDFDHPIRDRLPPGFKTAMRIVTTILDPGIYSDPYSDRPYLYGPALSSFFAFRIGEHVTETVAEDQLSKALEKDNAGVIEEGADGSGVLVREEQGIPPKTSKRRKNFLTIANLENFTFEEGRLYQADVFNPYLDFANFALRIPGFSISVVRYIDDKTHQLRYVLKNRKTEEVLFVVIFTLLFGDNLKEALSAENNLKESLSGEKEAPEQTLDVPSVDHRSNPSEKEAEPNQAAECQPNNIPDTNTRSSSLEVPTISSSTSRSPSPSTQSSDFDDERSMQQNESSVADSLASSIYSAFAHLGFGRKVSDSSSSSPESTPATKWRKSSNLGVDGMNTGSEEDYFTGRNANT